MARRTPASRARAIQAVAALGGLAALLWSLARLPYGSGPVGPGLRLFFVAWCVAVPYWHYAEYRWLLERDADGRVLDEALQLQRLSRWVWIGGVAAIGAFVVGGR